jgi:aconitate hydratase
MKESIGVIWLVWAYCHCSINIGESAVYLGLSGSEKFNISGVANGLSPLKLLQVKAEKEDGTIKEFQVVCRLDSAIEIAYYNNGGILHYVLRDFLKK